MRTNTASTQNNAGLETKISLNNSSSFFANEIIPDELNSDLPNMDTQEQSLQFINVLFSAFGRIFDIVLYPDHIKIPAKEQIGYSSPSQSTPTIFYHGHIKGMKKESDVSLTFHDKKLVSVKITHKLQFD